MRQPQIRCREHVAAIHLKNTSTQLLFVYNNIEGPWPDWWTQLCYDWYSGEPADLNSQGPSFVSQKLSIYHLSDMSRKLRQAFMFFKNFKVKV
jgi:hypothetical protein